MIVLGVSAYTHDTAVALIKNGKLVFFVEEERLNRKKHTTEFPILAIKKCLDQQNLKISDIDVIAISQIPFKEVTDNIFHVLRYFPSSLRLLGKNRKMEGSISFFDKIINQFNLKFLLKNEFKTHTIPKIIYYEHHLAHNASAFFCSPFSESALLSIDGRGESTTTLIGRAKHNRIQVLNEVKVPHSLGHLYAAITDYLGFRAFHDEWKVMGLSAYGSPKWVELFNDLIFFKKDGQFELNLKYFKFYTHGQNSWLSDHFYSRFGPPRLAGDELNQRHKDIAYALQQLVERAGVFLAQFAYERTKCENLCLSGGVVLNCLMNSQIIEKTSFKNFFIQPVANDAGAAIGAAWLASNEKIASSRSDFSIYLGPEYSDQQIKAELDQHPLNYRVSSNTAVEVAQLLYQGEVVAWYQGRMEAGPRALGNRSVLADPTKVEMKDRINRLIKKREFFRPFAPCVLEDRATEYFRLPRGLKSPHMVLSGKVIDSVQSRIPAVTHVDGTARVQTVSKDENRKFYDLLNEFDRLSGVPVLLNTSFNENEPIVCSPKEAIECFLRTDLDRLVMHDFIISKVISSELTS